MAKENQRKYKIKDMSKEQKFYNALRDVFVGAKIEGESGFVNLMRIKSGYYSRIKEHLEKDIAKNLKKYPKFREELFDKLYSFFSRYFTRSGSIYFNQTPFYHNIYEKVYSDEKDVILFWKTHMLYYVKSDRIFENLDVAFDNYKFFFDVSKLEHKRANEKRSLVYRFKNIRKDSAIVFEVSYSERGTKTKIDEIRKALKKKDIKIKDEDLERAFRTFEKQSEVDYFINKNAKEFLKEQFKIWLYQYVYTEEPEWPKERIDQLQVLKDIANKIIDFIAQFEDELVKIWNKPKFVRNSNYVITLDKLNKEIIEKVIKHKNFKKQIKEWRNLDIVDKENIDLFENTLEGKRLKQKYRYLPIDTKYFKDLELEILGLFNDLDNALDGWLIKSENYQALNTILPKFRGKVQTIYIDPPFNKETDADYFYSVKYKDATWISLLENRFRLAKDLLNEKGSIFTKCDYNGSMFVRLLMNEIFGLSNFLSEIIWKRFTGTKIQYKSFALITDTIYSYAKSEKWIYKQQYEPYSEQYLSQFKFKDKKGKYLVRNFYSPGEGPARKFFGKLIPPPKGHHWRISQEKIDKFIKEGRIILDKNGFPKLKMYLHEALGKPYNNLLTQFHVVQGSSKEFWGFPTQNPEILLKLFITSSSKDSDIVLDYFLGSSTTTAVAHKLGRKWLGVEMGKHFDTVCLPRMKEVLAGKGNHEPCGISKEVKWQGGGFFKYYELEQYEDTLRKVKYEDATLFEVPGESPYSQYVFMKDKKLLNALDVDYKKNKVEVDLFKLYDDIDIAESLSNLRGKYIKRITSDEVEFEDGEKIRLKALDYKLIKPLIWW